MVKQILRQRLRKLRFEGGTLRDRSNFEIFHHMEEDAMLDATNTTPLNMPTIFSDLHLNATTIMIWIEELALTPDWDSPAAKAIRDYLAALVDYQQCILAKPAEYAKMPAYSRGDMGEPAEYVESDYPRTGRGALS